MTKRTQKTGFALLAALIFLGLPLVVPSAFAEEAAGGWRSTYDTVMIWVNFLILVFLIVKFGKKPLMNFLVGQKDEVEKEIQQLETEKRQAQDRVDETERRLADSSVRFKEISERIVAQGEMKKQAIIEDAQKESRMLIEGAGRKVGSRLAKAKADFRGELVDAAIALATERLAAEITEADNRRLTDDFVASIDV